ncbi:MAG: sodium:solute symporter [Phycisphaeraceae bacterium]|nr:sodium:solute symporter [Phycisphaeraceae bacterium]
MLTWVDWSVLALSALLVIGIGAGVGWRRRRALRGDQAQAENEFFRASGRMPWWAVTASVVATSLSAVTFIGGPQKAYEGDLTYLSATVGMVIGVLIVGIVFVPAYYRLGVTTVYEALGSRYGIVTQRAASGAFLIGRVMASGARLFAASIPFALVVFGDLRPGHLQVSILAVACIACAYTAMGGIAAVVWTDLAQLLILLGAAAVAIALLLREIPADTPTIAQALRTATTADGTSKLTVFDWRWDLESNFAMPTVLLGWTLFNAAAFGTDQDLAQRLLTCRNASRARLAIIGAGLVGAVVTGVFMLLGLLLYLRHHDASIMGAALAPEAPEGRKVFLEYALGTLPTGVKGLLLAGLFAAALSSLDSALNAMASATVRDFGIGEGGGARKVARASRLAVLSWAVALTAFASGCVWWAPRNDLIDLALGVMIYAYSGLLGVFAAALLTRRGAPESAIAALVVGFVVTWALGQPWIVGEPIAGGWRMCFASSAAFLTCVCVPSFGSGARHE